MVLGGLRVALGSQPGQLGPHGLCAVDLEILVEVEWVCVQRDLVAKILYATIKDRHALVAMKDAIGERAVVRSGV